MAAVRQRARRLGCVAAWLLGSGGCAHLRVLNQMRVEYTMRRVARRLRDRAERHRLLRREEVEGAFKAAGDAREDRTNVPGEPLGAAVDEGYDGCEVGLADTLVVGLVAVCA